MKNNLSKQAKNTRRIAVCSVLSAIAFLSMLVGAVTDVLDLSMFVFASLCLVFAVIEMGVRWASLVWGVTSLLCLLLLPSKSAALLFVLGGVYPIAKAFLEKLPRLAAWLLKVLCFNLLYLLFLFLVNRVLGLTVAGFSFAVWETVFGNVAFILYDFCLTVCITFYLLRLKKRLSIRGLRDDE